MRTRPWECRPLDVRALSTRNLATFHQTPCRDLGSSGVGTLPVPIRLMAEPMHLGPLRWVDLPASRLSYREHRSAFVGRFNGNRSAVRERYLLDDVEAEAEAPPSHPLGHRSTPERL